MENKYNIGQKTFWEKEKLLVTSNFFFSYNVFLQLYVFSVSKCGIVW